MTATSLVAAAQSSRDRRLPLIISTPAPAWRRPAASTVATSLDSLAKQRTLRNPRSSRLSTSLEPMKPVAPVTRIGSSGPIIKASRSIWPSVLLLARSHISLLIGDVWLFYRVDAQEGKEPAYMIEEFH